MGVSELLAADRFATSRLGARLVKATQDRVVVEMTPAAQHLDGNGRISSGALFSLADCAMSLISNAETTAVAVATHFTTGDPVPAGSTVVAEARAELPGGERGTTWSVVLTADGAVIGSFTGTTYRVNNR